MYLIFFLLTNIFCQNIDFSSKKYKRLSDGKLLLNGDVFISVEGSKLHADKVSFDTKTQDFIAEGHAVLDKANGDKVEGDILSGNLKSHDFKGKNIYSSSKGGYFTGNEVEVKKIGEEKNIKLKHGSYTSCCNNPPDWEIWGSSISAKTEDYAYITNAVFKIKKVPFFYLPFFVFPTKTKRQTGFLFPIMHSGEDGNGFSFPFFVTLGKSHDFTITPGIIHHRGYNSALEFRSVFSKNSWQIFNGFYTQDKEYGESRYYLSLKNFFKLSENSYLLTNFAFVSDIFIARDFPFMMSNNYDPALNNKVVYAYNKNDFLLSSNLHIYQNLIEEGYSSRIPYISTFYNTTIGPIVVDFNFNIDNLKYNGSNDEDGFLNLKSNFSLPYSFYGFNFKPLLNLDLANLYYSHVTQTGEKFYFAYDFSLNIDTVMFRNYKKLYHSVEPFIEYHLKNEQSSYFDFYDFYDELFKISSPNYVVYGLRSRIISKANLFFEAKDIYDFSKGERQNFISQIYGNLWLFGFNTSIIIPDFNDLDTSTLNLGVRFGTALSFLGTNFVYSKDTQKQETFYGGLSFWSIKLRSRFVYDYLEEVIKEKLYSIGIKPSSKCWSFMFEAKDTFEKEGIDYRFMFSFILAGKSFGFEQE